MQSCTHCADPSYCIGMQVHNLRISSVEFPGAYTPMNRYLIDLCPVTIVSPGVVTISRGCLSNAGPEVRVVI